MELKVKNAAQAVDAAMYYLQRGEPQNAPNQGLKWQEKILYAIGPMDYAISSKLFSSGDWTVEVYQGVAPLINTIYQITVFNTKLHWFWKGSVKADGSLTEESPVRLLSEEESRKKSEELFKKNQVPPPKLGGYGH